MKRRTRTKKLSPDEAISGLVKKGIIPPDGKYENADARLIVDCGGAWVTCAWKHMIVVPPGGLRMRMAKGKTVASFGAASGAALMGAGTYGAAQALPKRRKAND